MKLPRRPVDYETRWSTVSYCVKFHIAFFEAAFTGAIFTHLVGDGMPFSDALDPSHATCTRMDGWATQMLIVDWSRNSSVQHGPHLVIL